MKEYLISLGLDGDKLFKNFKETIGILEQIQSASGEVGKVMDEAFNKGSKASEEFDNKVKPAAKNLETIRDLGKAAGKELADAMSAKNTNPSDFEKKMENFKKKISDITGNVDVQISDEKLVIFQRQIQEAQSDIEQLNVALNIGRDIMGSLDTNSEEYTQLAEAIEFCQSAYDELNQQIQENETALSETGNEASEAANDLEQLNDQLRETEDETKKVRKSQSDLAATFEEVYGDLQPMSTRLGEIEDRLYEMALAGQANTQEFQDLRNEAIRFRQTIQEVDASVDNFAKSSGKLDALVEGANGLVGAFAAVQGVVGLVAGENEELEAALLKVNSAMAILQGLQAVSQVLNKDSAFAVFFLSNSKVVDAAATTAQTAATTAANAAQLEATALTAALTAATEISSVVTGSNAAATIAAATAANAQAAANAASTASTTANTGATVVNTGATGANTVVNIDAAAAAAALTAAEATLTAALVAEAEAEVAATAATLARITANTEEAITAEAAAVATLAQATAARQLATADVQAAAGAVANATAQGAQTVAMGGATIAANVLGFALKAIGIGLIILAIAALVEYWDDLKDAMKGLLPAGTEVGKVFDKIKAYAFGVGEAILKYLIMPFKAAWQAINGDFKGAWETAKAGFDVVGNIQKGAQRQMARDDEKYRNEKEKKDIELAKRDLERRKNRGDKVFAEEQKLFQREIALKNRMRESTDEIQKQMEDAQDKQTAENRKKAEDAAKKAAADAKKKADEAEKKGKEEAKRNNDLAIKYGDELSKIKLENEIDSAKNQLEIIKNEARLRIEAIEREGATTAEAKAKAAELIAQINKKAQAEETELISKSFKEKFAIQAEADKQLTDLKKNGLDKDIDLLRINTQEQLDAITEKYAKDEATQTRLIEAVQANMSKKEIELKNKYAAESLKTDEEKAILGVQLASTYAKKSEETERQKQIALLRVRLEYAIKNLNQIVDDGTDEAKVRKLNAELAVNEAQEAVKEAVKKNKNRDFDFLDFLGIGEGMKAEDRQALRSSINQSIDILKDFTSFMIDNINQQMEAKSQQVEQTQSEIDDLESKLDDEKSLREQGLANNVEVIEAEIAEKERQKTEQIRQEEELLEKKKAMQKVQLALDTVTQLSGLITASVNIFQGFSTIPIVGIPLAIAMIGLMFGTFVASKAKAAQAINAQTVQHAEGGEISGRSHSQGGEKYYNADGSKVKELEDGEFVVKKRQYGKFGKLVRAINDNDFSGLTVNDYAVAEMFRGMGFDFDTGVEDVKNLQLTLLTMGYSSGESKHLAEISEGIAQLVESDRNTPKSWNDGVYNYLKVGSKTKKTRLIPLTIEENGDQE